MARKSADLKVYIDHVLEAFGPQRVMFGSDWPVCLLAGSYDRVIEAMEINLEHLNSAEREAIFGENAVRCYKITNQWQRLRKLAKYARSSPQTKHRLSPDK